MQRLLDEEVEGLATALRSERERQKANMDLDIRPSKSLALDPAEIWRYRELFYFFAWRDIKVRYKQTAIGASWAIIQPFVTMVVFTLFFNQVAGITSGAIPYAIFSYTGLIFWTFFSQALLQISNSMINNQAVITKMYFPRIIIPIAAVLPSVVDFACASVIFAGLLVYYAILPSLLGLALVLPMILLTALAALGLGMFFAALNVKYRDVRAVIPFVVQLGLFLTPVIYPVSLVPHRYQWLLSLNPMAGVINTMRAAMLHQGSVAWGQLGLSAAVAVLLVVFGLVYFKSTEREFADII